MEIPSHIQQTIQQKTELLRRTLGTTLVRWVPLQNVHLTLKFLGDVSPANLDILTQMLRTEADSCSSFDINFSGLGSFPSLRRPRILFVGIQAPAGLEALYHTIEAACARLGYASEERAFSPHLTIAHVKQAASRVAQQKIRQALAGVKIDSLGTARVDSVHLYKSELKPTGAVYTPIFSARLKKI